MSNHTLVSFKNAKPANLLSVYLREQNISNLVQQEANDDAIFSIVIDDKDRARASAILEDFLQNPQQSKYQSSAWDNPAAHYSANSSSAAPAWLKSLRQSPFTSLVLGACVVIFALSFLGFFPFIASAIAIQPLEVMLDNHQWWRIVGPNFLHFSFLHIAFNLVWWWMLGRQLELSFGTVSLVGFFVVASIFSNIAQLLVSGPNFGGMSGIVYALVGFVWWIGFLRPHWHINLPNNIIYFLLAWLVIGYFDVLWVNMANEAHTFGLISGCLMALLVHMFSHKKR